MHQAKEKHSSYFYLFIFSHKKKICTESDCRMLPVESRVSLLRTANRSTFFQPFCHPVTLQHSIGWTETRYPGHFLVSRLSDFRLFQVRARVSLRSKLVSRYFSLFLPLECRDATLRTDLRMRSPRERRIYALAWILELYTVASVLEGIGIISSSTSRISQNCATFR